MFSGGDQSLLFGEISGSALAGIEAALSRFLKPLLSESDGWGKADTEQKVLICFVVFLSLLRLCLFFSFLFSPSVGLLDAENWLIDWVDQKITGLRQHAYVID